MTRASLPAATEDVAARDPVLANLVALAGPIRHRPRDPDGPFGALVRAGYGFVWKLDPPPSAKELAPLGERFRPYRSIVARYCWAAVPLFRRGATDATLR